MAGDAVQKTINLFKHCCMNKIEPERNLKPLQAEVKKSYTNLFIIQFANGLDLLKNVQGDTPIAAGWLSEHEFYSLDHLVQGRIQHYQKLIPNMSTLVPQNKDDLKFKANTNENVVATTTTTTSTTTTTTSTTTTTNNSETNDNLGEKYEITES